MELAQWGAGLGDDLPWLDPPPQAALKEGRERLMGLGILTPSGTLSAVVANSQAWVSIPDWGC